MSNANVDFFAAAMIGPKSFAVEIVVKFGVLLGSADMASASVLMLSSSLSCVFAMSTMKAGTSGTSGDARASNNFDVASSVLF